MILKEKKKVIPFRNYFKLLLGQDNFGHSIVPFKVIRSIGLYSSEYFLWVKFPMWAPNIFWKFGAGPKRKEGSPDFIAGPPADIKVQCSYRKLIPFLSPSL